MIKGRVSVSFETTRILLPLTFTSIFLDIKTLFPVFSKDFLSAIPLLVPDSNRWDISLYYSLGRFTCTNKSSIFLNAFLFTSDWRSTCRFLISPFFISEKWHSSKITKSYSSTMTNVPDTLHVILPFENIEALKMKNVCERTCPKCWAKFKN